jgi:ElaB/YqjD/DUF883 family membrane-anchored ribosome-binding protein
MNTTTLSDQTMQATNEMTTELAELRDSVKSLVQASDHYVHQHAWTSVGLAAALGICVGLLVGAPGRRIHED